MSIALGHIQHAYMQTDGSYNFPNSREGDILKQAKAEIEELEAKLAECEVAIKELALEATTAEDQLELAEMKLAEVAEKCIKVHKRA